MRICFAGTPAFAAHHLAQLLASNHDVVAVYTQPDRPAGRGKKIHASPVKEIAVENDVPVYQPDSLRGEENAQMLSGLNADVMVVVAYGLILPSTILQTPKHGCLNVHASLLPRWRGAAPIERALLAGDTETGISIMQMDEGLDTGDVLSIEKVSIEDSDTRVDLERKLAEAGGAALLAALENLHLLKQDASRQDNSLSTYAAKLEKSEALIDWNAKASHIDRQVRAGVGRLPAYTLLDGQRVRVLKALLSEQSYSAPPGTIVDASDQGFTVACSDFGLLVESIQLPGKKSMTVKELRNSKPELFLAGVKFSTVDKTA